MSVGAVSGAGGGLVERAQRLVDDGPEKLRAFEAALQEAAAEPSSGLGAEAPPAGGAGGAAPVSAADPAAEAPAPPGVEEPGAAEKMLREVERGHQRLAELLGEIDSGRTFSPQELLGLQTEMHHVMRQIETAGKVLGEVVSGAKTLLQQQV